MNVIKCEILKLTMNESVKEMLVQTTLIYQQTKNRNENKLITIELHFKF